MPTLDEYLNQPEQRIFALFTSRSGDGKSAAAASFPKPFHELDFDGRFAGVANAFKKAGGWLEEDGPVTFERLYTKHGYEPLNAIFDQWDIKRASKAFQYKSIEIASVTNMVQALINSSHRLQSGKMIGNLRMSGPGDFNFEVTGMRQILDYLSILPCHVIVSSHVIDKYGKPKTGKAGEEYGQNEIIGEKLLLRDQPGEFILSCFGNVFRFSREVGKDNKMHYYVDFASDVAKNEFNIPPGLHDITNKPFYPFLQDLIRKVRSGEDVTPKTNIPTFNFGGGKP